MKPPIRKSGHYSSHVIRIAWLLSAGLSCVLPALAASATAFQVDLSGTLYYMAGVRWDSAIHVGTPFSMSLSYSTLPPETYSFPGYSTYVYPSQSAAMSFQVGPYSFSAGDIQLTVWNNSSYDGYLLATYAGSSPGFGHVEFNAVLQSSHTGLLANTELPIQEFAVASFDNQALTALTVEFAGYPGEYNYLGGSITAFSVTEVPEPSTAFLTVMGLAGLSWVFSKRR
jgi:hypothetical protein